MGWVEVPEPGVPGLRRLVVRVDCGRLPQHDTAACVKQVKQIRYQLQDQVHTIVL